MNVSILLDERRVLPEALVRPAPALVARDAQARRERPRHAGGLRLVGRDRALLLDQRRVVRGAHAGVVREQRGPVDVVVAVDLVRAVDHRDLQRRGHGLRLEAVDHVRPALRRVRRRQSSRRRTGSSRTGRWRCPPGSVERAALDLGHLADLVRLGHPRQQVVDALLDGQRGVEVRQPVGVDDDVRRGRAGTSAVVLVSLMPIVSAGSAAASLSTLTGNVCTAPEAVPAGNVSVPLRRRVVVHRRGRAAAGGVGRPSTGAFDGCPSRVVSVTPTFTVSPSWAR